MAEIDSANTPPPIIRSVRIWTWLDILLISVAGLALIILGTLGISYLAQSNQPALYSAESLPLGYNAVLAGVEALALIVSVYYLGIRRKSIDWQRLGLKRPTLGWILGALAIAAAFIPLLGLIAVFIQKILGLPIENPQLQFLVPEGFSWPAAFAMFILGGIVVPFAEEFYFRGVLYRWMRDASGPWIAAPLSAFIFGILHGDVAIAGASFVMGLVLAWFYERSTSLWPSIIIHMANNSIKLFLIYIMIALGIDPSAL